MDPPRKEEQPAEHAKPEDEVRQDPPQQELSSLLKQMLLSLSQSAEKDDVDYFPPHFDLIQAIVTLLSKDLITSFDGSLRDTLRIYIKQAVLKPPDRSSFDTVPFGTIYGLMQEASDEEILHVFKAPPLITQSDIIDRYTEEVTVWDASPDKVSARSFLLSFYHDTFILAWELPEFIRTPTEHVDMSPVAAQGQEARSSNEASNSDNRAYVLSVHDHYRHYDSSWNAVALQCQPDGFANNSPCQTCSKRPATRFYNGPGTCCRSCENSRGWRHDAHCDRISQWRYNLMEARKCTACVHLG